MTPMEAFYEAESTSIIKHLERRGMEGYYCPTRAEAVSLACSFIPPGSTVSWGGSETLIQCGMLDAVKNGDYEVIDRDSASSPQERSQLMHQALSADFFLMSSNAVTKDGQLVEAISRIHEQAAPPNTLRLNLKTPCSVTGVCADCTSKDCICAQTVVTRFNRTPGRIKVILIGETLGY